MLVMNAYTQQLTPPQVLSRFNSNVSYSGLLHAVTADVKSSYCYCFFIHIIIVVVVVFIVVVVVFYRCCCCFFYRRCCCCFHRCFILLLLVVLLFRCRGISSEHCFRCAVVVVAKMRVISSINSLL